VDHVGINCNTLSGQQKRKCVLGIITGKSANFLSSFSKRYYSCKVNNNNAKIDSILNNVENKVADYNNLIQRDPEYKLFKKEIISESKKVTNLIIISLNKGKWPMLNFGKEIFNLVRKRQKYLSLISARYNFNSNKVLNQLEE
jgi:hypothetical protein